LHLPIFVDANLAPATTTKTYNILNSNGSVAQTYTVPFYTSRIDPTGQVYVGYSDVNSWYNSMVITIQRRMRHGLEFTANYTLSRAYDGGQVIGSNGTFNGSDVSVDPKNRKAEYALSDLDQRHRFVANAVWMPLLGNLPNHAERLILNGWALSTIVTMSTGQPVTPMISGTPSPLDGGLTAGEASNANPTTGRAGWLPRNSFTQPGFHNVDFRLSRQFPITERFKLAMMGEIFNLFNHTNISSVNTTAYFYSAAGFTPNPAFMTPIATSNLLWGPRQVQISARLTF
jgi:hypothetical protein